ncbi:reverse transcriptase domain-containing protein [Tanacetum coccineum]
MKNNPQLQQQDIAIWLALQMKSETLQVPQTTYRTSAIRLRDQDDPHDDAPPEGENSAKRQKTSEYEAYVTGESSGQVNESEQSSSSSRNQEQVDDYNFWTESYASDDDEIPMKQKGNSGPEKIVLSLHKFPAIIFNDVDIEERTSRWVNKCVKKFNPYARDLTIDEAEYLKLFEEEIEVRLKYRNQMRRWEICEETHLVMNWEKCHFMVKEGIVVGHKISSVGIEAFNILKDKLTTAPVIITLNWNLDFELMCDASDYVVGAVLGQHIDKKFRPIYYASKTMNNAQEHYTTIEKELFVVVYTFDKFQSYLVMSKTVVYTDHSALKYLFSKQDAKPRLIRFYWPTIFKDAARPVRECDACQRARNISSRNQIPLTNIIDLKNVNLDLDAAGKNKFLQLDKLAEMRNEDYEHSCVYNERTKRWHDAKIMDKEFQEGEEVLVFNSSLKLFQGKMKTRWYGPYKVSRVCPYGTVEVCGKDEVHFKVNRHRLKRYYGGGKYNQELDARNHFGSELCG